MPSAHSRTRSASHERTEICGASARGRSRSRASRSCGAITARARRLLEESLAIHRDLDDAWGVSHSLSNLAFLALEAGDAETARTLLSEALAIERESGHQPRLANALEMSARLAAADGQPALATRLYARAALLRERVHGLTFEVGWPDPTPNLDDLRSRVGEETFEEEWARGRAMTPPRGDRPGEPGVLWAGVRIVCAGLHGEWLDRPLVRAVDRPVLADRANGLHV